MAGEKRALTKDEKADILWSLDYVMNSIRTYGLDESFNRPHYIMHLKKALEVMKGTKNNRVS